MDDLSPEAYTVLVLAPHWAELRALNPSTLLPEDKTRRNGSLLANGLSGAVSQVSQRLGSSFESSQCDIHTER